MSNFETLEFSTENEIATIVLNRPKAANGLNSQLAFDLREVSKICDTRSDIRAVILTANGRFFCAGGDIKHMASQGEKVGVAIKSLADDLHMAISTFARMDAPFIIAVNGMAAGAGFSLALAGDIVISSESAGFTMAYTKAGLSPDGSSSYFLPRLVGLRRAQELMLTNRTLTASEALAWGVVTKVVPREDLMSSAREVALSFAEGSRGANAAVKKLLLASFTNSLETQMEIEGREISTRADSPDGREGITAFTEKRSPKFS